jgi:DNA-binding transcriptional ArsR family regulator
MDESAAALALTTIRQQRDAVAERLTAARVHQWVAAVVMGAATAAQAVPHQAVGAAATVVFVCALAVLLGTPSRIGVVPASSRRRTVQTFLGCAALVAVAAVGLTAPVLGHRRLALLAGAVMVLVAGAVARWWQVTLRRELLSDATPSPLTTEAAVDELFRQSAPLRIAAILSATGMAERAALGDLIGVDAATLSRHLTTLNEAGLVTTRRVLEVGWQRHRSYIALTGEGRHAFDAHVRALRDLPAADRRSPGRRS